VGVIRRNARIRLIRNGIVVWDGSLANLRRFKDDAREVAAGYECGISLSNYQDVAEGDILEAYEIIEEKRHL
jgi:translation initiation factor IF-2